VVVSALGQEEEIAQYIAGAGNKIAGAAEIIAVPGCSSFAADLAYNGVGDAVNLLTRAVLRRRGRVVQPNEKAPALLREAVRLLSRGSEPLPDVGDLITIVLNRNGSVHEGAAAASEVEAVAAAAAVARRWQAACAAYTG
jgi:hypothetical protein